MSNVLSTLQGRLTSASYALAWWLVCRVPEAWGRRVFAKAGEIAYGRLPQLVYEHAQVLSLAAMVWPTQMTSRDFVLFMK